MNLYARRRNLLIKDLGQNSIAILFSSDVLFEQGRFSINRNFYYLTGLDKEDMALVLLNVNGQIIEKLFILPYDETEAKWVGGRMLKEEAADISGVESVENYNELEDFIQNFLDRYRGNDYKFYFDFWAHDDTTTISSRFVEKLKKSMSNIVAKDIFPYTTRLRLIKDEYEITCLKQAISITNKGIKSMMKTIKPNLNEMTMQGIFTFALNQNLCDEYSFDTIAASGDRATILHYSDNNQVMKDGELFLQDLGATFKHYCGDITRTYPVNGKFTNRQKEIYQIVLNVQKLVEENAKPGVKIRDLNNLVIKYYEEELPKHGLTKPVSEYYYHSISHHIGLDCHDADGGLGQVLQAGNVISNEPGLYIADEGIGIRIEDDLLITGTGAINLSSDIIKEIDDIEKFMAN